MNKVPTYTLNKYNLFPFLLHEQYSPQVCMCVSACVAVSVAFVTVLSSHCYFSATSCCCYSRMLHLFASR